MEISEIRRVNLKVLVKKYNNQAGLASMIGMAASQLSPLVLDKDNKNSRNIGEKLARKIERKLSLEKYYLDKINMALGQRIKQRMEELGIKQEELAKRSSVSQVTISRLITGINLETRKAPQIAKGLETTTHWLVTGEKESKTIHNLKEYQDKVRVPILSATLSMGNGIDDYLEHDEIINTIEPNKTWINHNLPSLSSHSNLRIVMGRGRSMVGIFNDGDMLWVDTGVNKINLDAIYALRLNGQLFIKNVQRTISGNGYELISENPTYKPKIVSDKDSLEVVGLVLGKMSLVKF